MSDGESSGSSRRTSVEGRRFLGAHPSPYARPAQYGRRDTSTTVNFSRSTEHLTLGDEAEVPLLMRGGGISSGDNSSSDEVDSEKQEHGHRSTSSSSSSSARRVWSLIRAPRIFKLRPAQLCLSVGAGALLLFAALALLYDLHPYLDEEQQWQRRLISGELALSSKDASALSPERLAFARAHLFGEIPLKPGEPNNKDKMPYRPFGPDGRPQGAYRPRPATTAMNSKLLNDPYGNAEMYHPPVPTLQKEQDDFYPGWYPMTQEDERLTEVESQQWLVQDEECLDQWITSATICDRLRPGRASIGEASTGSAAVAPSREPPVDIVFTWVNGTDPLHQQSRQYWLYCLTQHAPAHERLCPAGYGKGAKTGGTLIRESQRELAEKMDRWVRQVWPFKLLEMQKQQTSKDAAQQSSLGVADRRFHEMDELRYAIRSAVANIANLRTVHVVAPDFPASSLETLQRSIARESGEDASAAVDSEHHAHDVRYVSIQDGTERIGQRPRWLDVASPHVLTGTAAQLDPSSSAPAVRLQLHHDWSVFRPATVKHAVALESIAAPSFNSMAIEAVAGPKTVVGLSDTMIMANDDFFVLRSLTHADLVNPLYGAVIRLRDTWNIDSSSAQTWDQRYGEIPGLHLTNHILDRRFGRHVRRYAAHLHRGFSASLLQEARLIFREDLAAASKARFRGLGINIISHFLTYSMIIERHREAMLWSYIVLTLDSNGDGIVDRKEWTAGFGRYEPVGKVPLPIRNTINQTDIDERHRQAGIAPAARTQYRFSSGDGYPFARNLASFQKGWPYPPHDRFGKRSWPAFEKELAGHYEVCKLQRSCSVQSSMPASDLFRMVAFELPDCGDCILASIVGRSGSVGLSAALPPKDAVFPGKKAATAAEKQVPHLPLQRYFGARSTGRKNSKKPDFSAQAVATSLGWSGESKRAFANRLLMRYSYVLGHSRTEFLMAGNEPKGMATRLAEVDAEPDLALMCINDDIKDHEHNKDPDTVHKWFEARWPTDTFRSPFETA